MKTHFLLIGATVLVLTGCQTRSISDSGYRRDGSRHFVEPARYSGELNELDVLGIERNPNITDEHISKALDNAGRVMIRKGSNILLVQSGAQYPDEPMIAELKHA